MDTSVLIAGAGPAGLVLAIELARRGTPCHIVDAAAGVCPGSRGKGLQPRTLEVFEDLGVLAPVLAAGRTYPPMRVYAGREVLWEGRMMAVGEPTPDVPYPSGWMIPQWRTEAILRDHLAGLGVTVAERTELTGFTTDGDGVTATVATPSGPRTIRAAYLVGADGGRSTVRRVLGVPFTGQTWDRHRMIVGDLRVDGLDRDYWHAWGTATDRSDTLALCPLPGTDTYQLATADPGEEFTADRSGMRGLIARRTGLDDVHLREITWLSRWRANMRMAERFRVGRVFLTGDAAHVHSPAGGQGLNTSVQDSYNLGWKLAAVIAGADPALLDTYEPERIPVAAHVLGISASLHQQSATPAPAEATSPRPAAQRHESGRSESTGGAMRALGTAKRGRDTQQLDISYAGGPLAEIPTMAPTAVLTDASTPHVTRPADGPVRAGDRAPDATGLHHPDGSPARLFDLFQGPQLTVLAFGAHHAPDAAALTAPYGRTARTYLIADPAEPSPVGAPGPAALDGALTDTDGLAAKAYDAGPGTLVLVRPDGYIGTITDTPADITAYLTRVAAPAAHAATHTPDTEAGPAAH